jgi:protein TonB
MHIEPLAFAWMAMAAPGPAAAGAEEPVRAQANLASYLSDDDYPAEAIRKGEQGLVAFRLEVSASGAVSGCTVELSSGSALLDASTCNILSERARFTPARDGSGRAVADSVTGRIRWALPEAGGPPLGTSLRGVTNVWEVTADGRERSCRTELGFEAGERINMPRCNALNVKFVRAAAAYLQARPEEILTVRLENRWLLDPVLPFPAPPVHRGQLLARGEGDYRLNEDLSVRDCVEGRFSARFSWRTAPCFRKGFAEQVPADTRSLRMEVQWVVSRGPDTERPSVLPSFVSADGKFVVPVEARRRDEKEGGADPLGEGPHQP